MVFCLSICLPRPRCMIRVSKIKRFSCHGLLNEVMWRQWWIERAGSDSSFRFAFNTGSTIATELEVQDRWSRWWRAGQDEDHRGQAIEHRQGRHVFHECLDDHSRSATVRATRSKWRRRIHELLRRNLWHDSVQQALENKPTIETFQRR